MNPGFLQETGGFERFYLQSLFDDYLDDDSNKGGMLTSPAASSQPLRGI
jgi:hypothetical protein